MAQYSAIPWGRASPADFTTAVTTALVMTFALEHEDPSSTRVCVRENIVQALYFMKTGKEAELHQQTFRLRQQGQQNKTTNKVTSTRAKRANGQKKQQDRKNGTH